MATNKAKAIYFALASALVLGSSQMQAQTDPEDLGYVAPLRSSWRS